MSQIKTPSNLRNPSDRPTGPVNQNIVVTLLGATTVTSLIILGENPGTVACAALVVVLLPIIR